MTDYEQIQNRMAEEPDLDPLRATSVKPSWWERVGQPTLQKLGSRTGITVILAVTILIVLAFAVVILT